MCMYLVHDTAVFRSLNKDMVGAFNFQINKKYFSDRLHLYVITLPNLIFCTDCPRHNILSVFNLFDTE